MQVTCPKCKKQGTLTSRLTISYGIRYHYYYVQHIEFIKGKRKTTWHYLGKYEDLPEDIKKLIHKNIHNYTQNNNCNLTSNQETNHKTRLGHKLGRLVS
jgi:hypothetical protein